jgi:hypothetical protein
MAERWRISAYETERRIEWGRILGYVKFFPGYRKLSEAKMRQKFRLSEQDCGIR